MIFWGFAVKILRRLDGWSAEQNFNKIAKKRLKAKQILKEK
nr:hypothetical protein [uncultured Campylobacter sp.]